MAEVELNVVCKHCGAEVSPYITECPYCGNRLRKRAPKLEAHGAELAPKEKRGLFGRKRKPKAKRTQDDRPLEWLAARRPYAAITLVLASAIVYLVDRSGSLGYYDLGAIVGPLDGEWWRLITAQFNYTNLGYLFAVGLTVAIFGTSLERRYGPISIAALFLAAGSAGMYVTTLVEDFPIAMGGNGAALGLVAAWAIRDWRDRSEGDDTESDLLGAGVIAAVLLLIPLIDDTASWSAGLAGAATGALAGLTLPRR